MVAAALISPDLRDNAPRQYAYWEALRSTLAAIPGVTGVGLANWTPMAGGGASFVDIQGRTDANDGAAFRVVSDGYLEAIGVPLIAGRMIAEHDAAGSAPVAVINRAMAQRYWPGENPIGQRLRATSMEDFGRGLAPWRTVVGVVGDIRHGGFESEVRPEMYVPHRQVAAYWIVGLTAAVRSGMPIELVLPEIRARARRVDPNVAVDVGSLQGRASDRIAPQRMMMTLLGVFGAVSLLLAAMGTYGLLSYLVANRTRELAIRAALGATRSKLVALVVLGGVGLIGTGVILGIAGALAMSRLLSSQLVDVGPLDPVALGGAVAVIAVAALLAALVPALRASAANPSLTLRSE